LLSKFLIALAALLCGAHAARADDVFVVFDGASDQVQEYASGEISGTSYNGTAVTQSNLSAPSGIAFDGNGNMYVSNSGNSTITEYNSGGTFLRTISTPMLSNQSALAFDQFGDLYAANSGDGNVLEFTPAEVLTSTPTIFSSGLGSPQGLAFDSQGNLYVSDYANAKVWEIPSTGGTPSTFINSGDYSTINHPKGIAFDSQGNLYVANADSSLNDIEEFSSQGVAEGVFASSSEGLSNPDGLAFDSKGDLFEVNFGHPGYPENDSPILGFSQADEFAPGEFSNGVLTGGQLLESFNDNTADPSGLEDGGYIAIESDSGVPLLGPIPEPSTWGLSVLSAASFAGFAWIRRRRA
jgi:sugar lactone lactonase YvrE